MEATAITGPLPIGDLITTINNQHQLVVSNSLTALAHATIAGEGLLAARNSVGLADWTEWLQENISFGTSTAQRYIRLAHYQNEVRDSGAESIADALEAIKGLPPTADANDLRRAPASTVEQAKSLYSEGVGTTQIAERLGVNRGTVNRWTNPESQQKSLERHQRRRDEQRDQRLARQAEAILPKVRAPLDDSTVAIHRREGRADAAVLLVAKRIVPSMDLADWGHALDLHHRDLVAAVGRFKARIE